MNSQASFAFIMNNKVPLNSGERKKKREREEKEREKRQRRKHKKLQ